MVRFNARTLVVTLYAVFIACAEPHQPGPPPTAPSPAAPPPAPAPPPPPPAPPAAPAPKDTAAAKDGSGSYTWPSGPIAAP